MLDTALLSLKVPSLRLLVLLNRAVIKEGDEDQYGAFVVFY